MPEEAEIDQHEQIARRAYELYLARGRRDGFDSEDWYQAEAEILAEADDDLGPAPAQEELDAEELSEQDI